MKAVIYTSLIVGAIYFSVMGFMVAAEIVRRLLY